MGISNGFSLILICILGALFTFNGCSPRDNASRLVQDCNAESVEYQGWSAFKLSNGIVTLTIVPDIGGRVMEFNLGGHPLFYVNPAEFGKLYAQPETEAERVWHNYGGYKTWPAPQSRWGGPPDPPGSLLDGGKYTGRITQKAGHVAEVEVVSPEDEVIGIQFIRRTKIQKGTTHVLAHQTMVNISDKPVTWSIWDVTQVPAKLTADEDFSKQAWIYFPLNPNSIHEKGYRLLDGEPVNPEWHPNVVPGIMGVQFHFIKGKVGSDNNGGWIAYVDQVHNYAYVKRFKFHPEAEYPDGGCASEVWCDYQLPYMEVEVLSPLKELAPGESYSFDVDWYSARCPGPIVDANELGVVNQPLEADVTDDTVNVTGVFGVFYSGNASVIFKTAENRVLYTSDVIPVEPNHIFLLDKRFNLPAKTSVIEIEVRDVEGKKLGVLAKVTVS
ncbi:MAG: DUF4380 domain-containing protein [bacterium]